MDVLLNRENPKQENDSQSFILVGWNSAKEMERWPLKCDVKCLSRIVHSTASILRCISVPKPAVIL